MNVARMLFPVKVLGPGDRVGIWLCGCDRRCKGCSNPELWVAKAEYEVSTSDILSLINRICNSHTISGFTITGGEPFDQSNELLELIKGLRFISHDILVYTGYLKQELEEKNDRTVDCILENIAVLIDGPYIEELNTGVRLRGSSNQSIIILDPEYRELYTSYLKGHNQIQNFMTSDGAVSVGIHNRGFSSMRNNKELEE